MFRVGDFVHIKGTPNGLPGHDYVIGLIGRVIALGNTGNPVVCHKGKGPNMERWYYKKEVVGSIHTEVFKAIKRHEALLKP